MKLSKVTITRAENGYILSKVHKTWDGSSEEVRIFPLGNSTEYKALQTLLNTAFEEFEITVKPKFPPNIQLAAVNGRLLGRIEE